MLSTEPFDVGAQDVRLRSRPRSKIRDLGDLTEACGEKGKKAIVQGKSHVNFVEVGGKLYFATHVGYYTHHRRHGEDGHPPAGLQALSRAATCSPTT